MRIGEGTGVRLHEDGASFSVTAAMELLMLRGSGPDVVGRTGSSQAVFANRQGGRSALPGLYTWG